jgi:predicted amidohydrolase YtcJ
VWNRPPLMGERRLVSAITRKDFLGVSALAAAGIALGDLPQGAAGLTPRSAPSAPRQVAGTASPDMILVNGRVFTVDEDTPTAEAFAVKDGRFVAVGSSDDIRNLAARGTRVFDAAGMTVTPGFIDAHTHPTFGGIAELVNVNVNVGTVARIKELLAARARQTPQGEWVIGFMYDDTKLAEGPLTKWDLDEAVPNHPAVVRHRGGHTAVYNSMAFELAGVTADTPDPAGGRFYREGGQLTGKVAELAREQIDRLIPSETTREQRRDGAALISRKMAESGLTSVHDTGIGRDEFIAYQDARDAGELRFRAYLFANRGLYPHLRDAGIRSGVGDEHIRIGAVKYVADGSASERTMAMSTPYVGRPDDYGILTMTQEEIHEAVEDAHRAGWQIGIHANGDLAIAMVLNAYERAQRMWPREDPRHRIEHCTLVNPDLLRRIAAIEAIPTPFYTYVYYHGEKWAEYGEEKVRWMFAHRSFLDYGILVASASDYTPGPYEPMMAIQSMVTRTDYLGTVWGANQRVTVDEALKICTHNAAYASREEDVKGTITPGKLADFTVLAEDPHDVDPGSIIDIPVVWTVMGGRTTHEA